LIASCPNGEFPPHLMKTPERTTAEVFPRYLGGEVLADSAMLKWLGLFARRYRFPRVVDGFLVPATAEPLITCTIYGSAEFHERDIGCAWVPRQVRRGDIFVTGSKNPYELRWRSPPLGAEMDVIHIHLGVDQCLAAFEMVYPYVILPTSSLSSLTNNTMS
jgi:AraC family transcriptional regulator